MAFYFWTAAGGADRVGDRVESVAEHEVQLGNQAQAANVLSHLGYRYGADSIGSFVAPVTEFLGRGHRWLQQHIDAMSPAVPGAAAEGWLNRRVFELVKLAQVGKANGANLLVGFGLNDEASRPDVA